VSAASKRRKPSRSPPGEHIELAVAAQLARIRLMPDAFRRYQRARLFALLDAAAQALVRVAPIYMRDPASGRPLELAAWELQGAQVLEGGNRIVLRDGRILVELSMRRDDLADAIALLRRIGARGLTGPSDTR